MGKKKILYDEVIPNERLRRISFKKRRIGLLRKAIQLSQLSGCLIDMKIYNPEDMSLLHYISEEGLCLNDKQMASVDVKQYMKFLNQNAGIVEKLENNLTSHGAAGKNQLEGSSFIKQIESELEGFNIYSFFSFSKAPLNDESLLGKRGR